MGSINVIKSTFLRGNPISGQTKNLKERRAGKVTGLSDNASTRPSPVHGTVAWAPCGSHMGPFGPICAYMGPIWDHVGPYGPIWSHMVLWDPYGAHMVLWGPNVLCLRLADLFICVTLCDCGLAPMAFFHAQTAKWETGRRS